MKKKAILNSILVSTLMLSGAGVVNAAEQNYLTGTKAESFGLVEFIETDEAEIVDPDNPDKPIIPGEPGEQDPTNPNPDKGDLVLQYVPNLDFGTHKKTSQGLEKHAKLIKAYIPHQEVKPGSDPIAPKTEERIPFVSTLDTRAERDGGWQLTVKRTEFENEDNAKIKGADVIFSDLIYNGEDSKKPTVRHGEITIGTEPNVIAQASEKEEQGMGSHSLSLGQESAVQKDYLGKNEYSDEYNVTTGVTFKLAKGAAVSADKYQSTFEWNLVPSLEETNK